MTGLDLSVLIVSHGHADMIRECLASLDDGLSGLSNEIVVIDNLAEPDFLARIGGERAGMTVIPNERRLGFGANMNKAASVAKGRVLLILNPDTRYHAGQIADAVEYLEADASRGIVAARLLNDDLSDQRNFRTFPSMSIALLRGFGADRWTWRPSFYRESLLESLKLDRPANVDWVYGSFMLIRKATFDAFGGFDEGYFMYYEDVDLCYRLRKQGFSTSVYPDLLFLHHHLRTSAESALGTHRKHHIRSLARYLWKSNGYLFSPHAFLSDHHASSSEVVDRLVADPKTGPLAAALGQRSLRPLVQIGFMAAIAASSALAAYLVWGLLSLGGQLSGSFDSIAANAVVLFVCCVLLVQFMLQEMDPARLGDSWGRVVGVAESSIIASFPVALLFLGYNPAFSEQHRAFLFLMLGLSVLLNPLCAFLFSKMVASEGVKVGVVGDFSRHAASVRPPELPVGLQTVSSLLSVHGNCVEEATGKLADAIKAGRVDQVLLVLDDDRDGAAMRLVRNLSMFDIPIWHAIRSADGTTMRPVALRTRLRSRTREALKRGFDMLGALAALILCFVPMLVIAIAIKLEDRGPVFFGQPRLGRNQVPFMMLKFRSMYAAKSDVFGDKLTTRGDARITRVGAFLRRTSLDELPQLINVLLGDMSIVGPRPLPVGFHFKGHAFDKLIPEWAHRYRVRPGITGLSQIKGLRGTPDTLQDACKMMSDRVRHDNHYIDHWSIWLDIKIIAMTVLSGAFMSGAY